MGFLNSIFDPIVDHVIKPVVDPIVDHVVKPIVNPFVDIANSIVPGLGNVLMGTLMGPGGFLLNAAGPAAGIPGWFGGFAAGDPDKARIFGSLNVGFTGWMGGLGPLLVPGSIIASNGVHSKHIRGKDFADAVNARLQQRGLKLEQLDEAGKAALLEEAVKDAPADAEYTAPLNAQDQKTWNQSTGGQYRIYTIH